MLYQRMWGEHFNQRFRELKELIIGGLSHNHVAAMAEHQMYDTDIEDATSESPLTYLLLIVLT